MRWAGVTGGRFGPAEAPPATRATRTTPVTAATPTIPATTRREPLRSPLHHAMALLLSTLGCRWTPPRPGQHEGATRPWPLCRQGGGPNGGRGQPGLQGFDADPGVRGDG